MASSDGAGILARLGTRFRLHDNWRQLVRHAWSVRFACAATLCESVALFCQFFTDAEHGRLAFALVGLVCTALAGLARLMPQAAIAPAADPAGDA
ncbi:hypothetical protein ACLBYG_22545 [Methylobacterium sp. D53M]